MSWILATTTGGRHLEVDEPWIREWVEFGMRMLATYLERQAAFQAYLEREGRQ